MVKLSNDDDSSASRRPLAAEIDIPPLLTPRLQCYSPNPVGNKVPKCA
jgi:hypothetical protein